MTTLLLALILQLAPAWDSVTVARVIDGDTFVTVDSVRVRLLGVDTPELRAKDTTGIAARRFVDSMICGKRVRLEYEPGKRTGYYGRTLAYVYFDLLMVNLELIRRGHSKPYLKYPFSRSKEFSAEGR